MPSLKYDPAHDLEQQTLLNRAAVAVSRFQNLSFLPDLESQSTGTDSTNKEASTTTDQSLRPKEGLESLAMFDRSERLGVGAKPLQNSAEFGISPNARHSAELEILRRRLLGRKKVQREPKKQQSNHQMRHSEAANGRGCKRSRSVVPSSDDEGDGRTTLIRAKKINRPRRFFQRGATGQRKSDMEVEFQDDPNEERGERFGSDQDKRDNYWDHESGEQDQSNDLTAYSAANDLRVEPKKPSTGNFLDEVLSERKRNKKKTKADAQAHPWRESRVIAE